MSETHPLPPPPPNPFNLRPFPFNTIIPISRTVCVFIETRGVTNLEITVHGKQQ